jgi:PAS domain S-box-containing protein
MTRHNNYYAVRTAAKQTTRPAAAGQARPRRGARRGKMNGFYLFYQVAMITSMVVSLAVMLLVIHLQSRPGARMMAVVTGATFLWTLGFYLESHAATLAGQLFYNNLGYVGLMVVPIAWFVFSAQYVGAYRLSNWRLIRWVALVPLAVIVLVWTNQWHHLMWRDEHLEATGAFIVTAKTYGPFFWIAAASSYFLIVAGVVVLVRRLFTGPPLYRNQAIALVIASALPLIGNAFYLAHIGNIPHKDLTPVAFALSGLTVGLGFWRFQLFKAVPFAREIVVRRLKDGIFIFSPDGRLLDANTAALDIVGSGQGIIGASLPELKLVSPLFETLSSGGPRRQEVSFDLDGSHCTYELDTTALRDNRNRLAGWLTILHDVTERKEGERSLAAALDHEREMRRKLEEEISRRLRFSQALAHEVRELADETGTGGRRPVRPARRGAASLDMRLDELLDFTRGEMGLLETAFRVISPAGAIRDTAAEMGATVSLRLPDTLPSVRADESRFRQILRCLLDNAITRTGPNDTIEMAARQEGTNLIVEVRDSGPVLDELEQASLFNPYERAALEPMQPGGLGLGLALGKMLVELHGGRMWAESRPGEGSAFAFSLPVAAPAG